MSHAGVPKWVTARQRPRAPLRPIPRTDHRTPPPVIRPRRTTPVVVDAGELGRDIAALSLRRGQHMPSELARRAAAWARDAHAIGASQNAIANALSVTRPTISNWLEAAA